MNARTFVALLAGLSVAPGPARAGDAEDAVAVLQVQVGAWNRGDLAAFCEVYVDDTTFLSPSGVTRGRQAVLDRYKERYPDKAAMGTLALDPIEARPASAREGGPAVVSVAARWTLSYPDKPKARGLTLLVLHRQGARWRIVQDASF
ncbi:MAG TPA: nuclear transport factor 2 family protein [Vicinamibacteria bacterium]